MYSAETTIVDVKQTGEEEYTLSMTAKELYVAAQSGDVLRRHDVSESDKAPEKKYVALSGVKFAEATGKYTFTFASGDVMEASSADAYPTASSISDATGGGSGGLPEVTASDVGKVATVVSEYAKGTAIAAEQTLTIPATLVGDSSLFTEGATCCVTVDGVDYYGKIERGTGSGASMLFFAYPGLTNPSVAIYKPISGGDMTIYKPTGEHVVSMCLAEESAAWAKELNDPFLVKFSAPSYSSITCSKTFEEIDDAYKKGKSVIAHEFPAQGGSTICSAMMHKDASGDDLESYSSLILRYVGVTLYIDKVSISSDNTVTSTEYRKVSTNNP